LLRARRELNSHGFSVQLISENVTKEDVLAHLSDQLLVLSERIQQLERKQMIYVN